jgi:GNAT superfamily N-acetyltransferase
VSAVNQLSDYTLRPATEDHESALRAWLPQAFLGRPRPAFLIATPRNDPGTPVAGASLRLLTEDTAKVGRFLLFVEPEHRRLGLGVAMMAALSKLAAAAGCRAILAGRAIDESDGGMVGFFERAGCLPLRTLHLLRVPTARALDVLDRICEHLERRGKIPSDHQIVPLSAVLPEPVAHFILRQLGGFPEVVMRDLSDPETGYDPACSLVLGTAEGVKGAILARVTGGVLRVESRAIDSAHRRGWMNAVLLRAFVEKAMAAGHTEVQFEADESLHAETLRTAAHGDGGTVARQFLFGKTEDGVR